MTGWDSYVAAVGQLDAVRRDTAAAVVAQEKAAQAARAELSGVRQRIALQRIRLIDVATRKARPAPIVEPSGPDRAAAAALLPSTVVDPTPGVTAALRGARATLDAADATLSIAAEAPAGGGFLPSWPPAARNALPYAWYAALAVVAVSIINAFAYGSPDARVVALMFDIVVPFGAFVLGMVSVRLLGGQAGGKSRGALIGATICAVPFAIGVILSIL